MDIWLSTPLPLLLVHMVIEWEHILHSCIYCEGLHVSHSLIHFLPMILPSFSSLSKDSDLNETLRCTQGLMSCQNSLSVGLQNVLSRLLQESQYWFWGFKKFILETSKTLGSHNFLFGSEKKKYHWKLLKVCHVDKRTP